MVCIILERSNTDFTPFLPPSVDTGSLCGTKLAGLCLRYDVGGIDWYPVVKIEHGRIEVIHSIRRNLLTNVSDVRVASSEA